MELPKLVHEVISNRAAITTALSKVRNGSLVDIRLWRSAVAFPSNFCSNSEMDTAELRIGYEPDPSGYGSITVSVTSSGFSGATGFAATDDELIPFLDALAEYPVHQPAKLSIGEFPDGMLIVIEVSPANSRGGLRVNVELRDHSDRSRLVSTSLYTVYPDLEAFRAALSKAIRSGGEVVLRDEVGWR